LGGIVLLGSSENKFNGESTKSNASFQPFGVYRIMTDGTSYQNEFTHFEIVGTNEVSISNTASNFLQYCLVGSTCNTNTAWSTIGTAPY
jgi:hypothetical protein